MSLNRRRPQFVVVLCVCLAFAVFRAKPAAQGISTDDLHKVTVMLRDAYDAVKKNYYDPAFHGLDWDARFKDYSEKIKTSGSLNAGVVTVSAFLEGLNDSHTYLVPPSRPYHHDYGYRMAFIGDEAMITRARPDTDAATKVNAGDRVLRVNNNPVSRETFASMQYVLGVLSPQASIKLALRDPSGAEREVLVSAKVKKSQQVIDLTGAGADVALGDLIRRDEENDHLVRQRYVEMGDVMIWKMPTFDVESGEIDKMIGIAKKHSALVIDLRGNGGGLVSTLSRMLGGVFDHDVVIGDRVARKDTKHLLAKSRGAAAFTGKLIVLTDSQSASASEIFAKVVQLEKRGTVIGDRSAGAVMEALGVPCVGGAEVMFFYAVSVTDADLVMKDGKSLERIGVTPDEIALPVPQDLAAGRDPVLAKAAQLAGLTLDPVAAGKLFPFEWRPF